jgi:hypothetical protein
LLKNDGQKFLAMMESLADKRIQREQEAAGSIVTDDDVDDDDLDDDDEDYDDGKAFISCSLDSWLTYCIVLVEKMKT